jgi:outer membrane protein assembly factor BamA
MRLARFAAALLCLTSLPVLAQYTVGKVVIRGGAPYTDAELAAVSGMQAGQMLGHDSLAMAAQHLLDTGVFDDTEVSLSGDGKARTVVFALKTTPLAKMMPASFANFVWWTPDQLTAAIHSRVPLYRGRLPDAGNLPDLVQGALTQMLAAKGIKATVSHATVEPTSAHPVRVVDFRIDAPSVHLQSATLSGAPPELAADMQRATTRFAGWAYNEGLTGDTLEDRLLAPLRKAGYIAAALDDIHRDPAVTADRISVAYSAHVQPGAVYKVSAIDWSATPVFSADDFAHNAKLHAGDIASQPALQQTEGSIVAVYRAKGYLDAFIEAAPKLDAAHTVAYTLSANPGEQYHLHSVTPLNLSEAARHDFDAGWRLKPGDVYDEHYVATFLTSNTALRNLAGYTASFQADADPQTHLVDLTINFVVTGSRR